MLIAFLVIAAASGVFLALKSYDPRRRETAALLLLRLTSLALLMALVIDPRIPVPRPAQRDWAVVVDGSASMAIEDSTGRSRAARGLGALPAHAKEAPVMVMGSTPRTVKPGDITADLLDAPSTDLEAMLDEAWRRLPDIRRLVLISDGRSIGPDPAVTARMRGLQVSCIGVDGAAEAPDVALVDLIVPSQVLPDQPFTITATLRLRGAAPGETSIEVEIGGKAVSRRACMVVPDSTVRVELTGPGLDPGLTQVGLVVNPVAGEVILDNNRRSAPVLARAAKWNVRIVADAPAWDLAFLGRSLARDGGFDVQMKVRGMQSQATDAGLPDVVVVGQWHRGCDQAVRETAEATLARGGAVVILGWPSPACWRGLSPLLTVEGGTSSRRLKAHGLSRRHPVVAAWGEAPPLPVTFPDGAIDVAGAALVLMETEEETPAVATQPSGGGQVLTWLGADWWRWQLADTASGASPGPWPAILRWLLSPEAASRLRLHLGTEAHDAGEPITVGLEVFGPGWQPAPAGGVELEMGTPGGPAVVQRRITMAPGGLMPVVELPGLAAGEWELRALATLAKGDTLRVSTQIIVSPVAQEQRLLHPDLAGLARLAASTGGTVVHHESAAAIDSLLAADSGLTIQRIRLRRTPVAFVVLVALLGVEWWLRGRRGLP